VPVCAVRLCVMLCAQCRLTTDAMLPANLDLEVLLVLPEPLLLPMDWKLMCAPVHWTVEVCDDPV